MAIIEDEGLPGAVENCSNVDKAKFKDVVGGVIWLGTECSLTREPLRATTYVLPQAFRLQKPPRRSGHHEYSGLLRTRNSHVNNGSTMETDLEAASEPVSIPVPELFDPDQISCRPGTSQKRPKVTDSEKSILKVGGGSF
jgi:hypothetical protein